tara:strand:+ start:7200 stop:7697 length:498 start_codon:yes stop_codon:yes gene_type:complete
MNLDKLCSIIQDMKGHTDRLKILVENHKDIIIIGNGGSNAIASHLSQDYTKALGKRAHSFSDPSRLTCYINDYGRDEAYAKFLEHFATEDTLVILISSSGNSQNICNAARYCIETATQFITLTGFDCGNELNLIGHEHAVLNYWIDATDYGEVECAHEIFLHSII